MEKRNITISISKDILYKFKLLAVRKGTSVSGLMAELMEQEIAEQEGYRAAQQQYMDLLNKVHNLGTQGKADWSREALHER